MENTSLTSAPSRSSDNTEYYEGIKLYSELLPKLDKLYNEKSLDILSWEISYENFFWASIVEAFDQIAKGSMLKDLIAKLNNSVNELKSLKESINKPFLLFVIGMGKYGKSTLVNALLGREFAEVGVLPKTWKIDIFEKADRNSDEVNVELVFRDSGRETMSEIQARQYLADEEEKRKRSELEAVKMFDTKSAELATIEAKEEYKAYLEKTMIYQSPVEEVIWHIPSNGTILDEFRLVDTPGLIQDLLGDSKNGLSEYYFKADGVIWLLDATTISAKKSHELIKSIIHKSGNEEGIQNAIAVLNRIDQVRSQQGVEGAEKVLEQAQQIYGKVFPKIIPFSAKQAWLGVSTKDQIMISQSNIDQLLLHIKEVFGIQAKIIRYKSKSNGINLLHKEAVSAVNSYLMRLKVDTMKLQIDRLAIEQEALYIGGTLKRQYRANLERYRKQVVSRITTNFKDLAAVKLIDHKGEFISSNILDCAALTNLYNNMMKDLEASIRNFFDYQIQKVTLREFGLVTHNFAKLYSLSIDMPSIMIGDSFVDNTAANTLSAGALGAIIGSFVVPGLGTVLGAFVGGVLGVFLSETEQAKLQKLHQKIQEETDEIINDVSDKIQKIVEDNFNILIDKLIIEQEYSYDKLHCELKNEAYVIKLLSHKKYEGVTARQMAMLLAIMSPQNIDRLSKE